MRTRASILPALALVCCLGQTVVCTAAEGPKTGEKRDTLLYVQTTPTGAKVLLDGKELGTSDDLFSVAPGVGKIVIELEGHEQATQQVTIQANRVTRLELVLRPKASDLAVARAAPQAENVLVNPGAENGDKTPDGWQQGAAMPGVKYSWDKEVAIEGKASLAIEKTANRYFPIAQWSQTVEYTGGAKALEVSAQVKAQKVTKAILDVLFLDKDGQWISHEWAAYIGSKEESDPPANHNWKKYSGKVAIPEGTAKICIGLQDYGPGKVWFDDVRATYVK